MKFMLLSFFVFLATLSCACEPRFEDHIYLLARDQSLSPTSSHAYPFILVSYDIVQDVSLAHLRTASEMLEQNLELIVLDNNVGCFDEGTLYVREISNSKMPFKNFDAIFKATGMTMVNPLVMFSKKPGDDGFVRRTIFDACEPGDKGCTPIYVRTGRNDGFFVFTYDSEYDDTCAELSNCSSPSHIDLFRKIYNIRMNGPKFIEHACTLCFFVFAQVDTPANVAVSFQLLEEIDRPEIFWDILKEYIKQADKFKTVSKIFCKKYPGENRYRLIFRLTETPSTGMLDSIRSIVRPLVGPCSSIAKEGDSECGVAMYQAYRFHYSDFVLSPLSLSNKEKGRLIVKDEKGFLEVLTTIKGEAGFKMGRTFPGIRKIEFFHATIDCPKFDRRQVFERFTRSLFFSGSRWCDNLARIELRMGQGNFLSLHAYYYMLTENELIQVQKYLIKLGKDIYNNLTGKKIGGSTGQIVNVPLPMRKTVPKQAEVTVPMNDGESRIKPSFTKKCAHRKNKYVSSQKENLTPRKKSIASLEVLQAESQDSIIEKVENTKEQVAEMNPTISITQLRSIPFSVNPVIQPRNVMVPSGFATSYVEPEADDKPEKPLMRPCMSKFESFIYDLTEDEFEHLLVDFEKSLRPPHLANLNHLPSVLSK